jgi:GTP-binding protein EngB required for normal cell division
VLLTYHAVLAMSNRQGRSNVGKSSLLNALMSIAEGQSSTASNGRHQSKSRARVSKTPGRTQVVQYFGCHVKEGTATATSKPPLGYLVDLPGYGYAATAPEDVIASWQQSTQDFLLHRRDTGVLQRLYLLRDARHNGGSSSALCKNTDDRILALDESIQSWFDEAEIPYCVVWTKIDHVSRAVTVKCANHTCARYSHQHSNAIGRDIRANETSSDFVGVMMSPIVHLTSARTAAGVRELWFSMSSEFHRPGSLSNF